MSCNDAPPDIASLAGELLHHPDPKVASLAGWVLNKAPDHLPRPALGAHAYYNRLAGRSFLSELAQPDPDSILAQYSRSPLAEFMKRGGR